MSTKYDEVKNCFHCGRGIGKVDTFVETEGKMENYCNSCGDLAMIGKLPKRKCVLCEKETDKKCICGIPMDDYCKDDLHVGYCEKEYGEIKN